MTASTSGWKRPPVVEVVLGVQFKPLEGLSNSHLGLLWDMFADRYPIVTDAPFREPVYEIFDDGPQYGIPMFNVGPARPQSRVQMVDAKQPSRMIQIQNGWLVVNWMKQDAGLYPGYSDVRDEFCRAFHTLESFIKKHHLGVLKPNLWEVTYIDHVARGTVWQDFSDLSVVVPRLLGGPVESGFVFEGVGGNWGYRLQPQPGRMTVSLQNARSSRDLDLDLLVMTFAARGPISESGVEAVTKSLNYGQENVVKMFESVASEQALAYWRG